MFGFSAKQFHNFILHDWIWFERFWAERFLKLLGPSIFGRSAKRLGVVCKTASRLMPLLPTLFSAVCTRRGLPARLATLAARVVACTNYAPQLDECPWFWAVYVDGSGGNCLHQLSSLRLWRLWVLFAQEQSRRVERARLRAACLRCIR